MPDEDPGPGEGGGGTPPEDDAKRSLAILSQRASLHIEDALARFLIQLEADDRSRSQESGYGAR